MPPPERVSSSSAVRFCQHYSSINMAQTKAMTNPKGAKLLQEREKAHGGNVMPAKELQMVQNA